MVLEIAAGIDPDGLAEHKILKAVWNTVSARHLGVAEQHREALNKLAAGIEPPLIVIPSDINMPVMDGLELLRQIKTRRPDLPVMMVTAYGDDERRHLAGEYGAAEFITKPVDFDFLKTQLRDLSDAAD